MKLRNSLTVIFSVTLTLLLGVFVVFADNWAPPVGSPPGNNTPSPINVGGNAQVKQGGLIVGAGLAASQTALLIPTGNLLVGTAVTTDAPNGSAGNINVNDIYIRSLGKWASQLTLADVATTTPGSRLFDRATTTTFVVPSGVTRLTVEAWGAGGGGMGACTVTSVRGVIVYSTGGGGGAGAYAKKQILVTPGESYTVVVGAGGVGSAGAPAQAVTNFSSNCKNPASGGDTSFGGNLLLVRGGRSASYESDGDYTERDALGGPGGVITAGVEGNGGGAGSDGVRALNETRAGGNGGSLFFGGNGGAGTTGRGGDGAFPGGGGAGGGSIHTISGSGRALQNINAPSAGGSGADGKIFISW